MATFLQMDGIDDFLRTPTLTFTKVEIDYLLDSVQQQTRYALMDTRIGYNGIFDSAYVVGGTFDKNPFPADGKRKITVITMNATSTDDVNIFSWQDGTRNSRGFLYNIKFYNGTTLVAHYDMNTKTVLDQSGNGKHATLTGGTWVTDTPTTTVQEGQATVSGESNATTQGFTMQSGNALISADSEANVIGLQIQSGEYSVSGESLVSAEISIDTFGNALVFGESNATLSALVVKSASSSVSIDSNASLTATLSTSGQANVSSETLATATYIPDSTVIVPETPEISGSVSVESNATAVLTPVINGVSATSSESYATVIGSQVQSGNGNTSIATESTLETSSITYGQYSVSIESSTSLKGSKVTIGESFVSSTSSAIAEFIHEIPTEYEKSIDVQLFVVRDLNKTLSIQREINATLTV